MLLHIALCLVLFRVTRPAINKPVNDTPINTHRTVKQKNDNAQTTKRNERCSISCPQLYVPFQSSPTHMLLMNLIHRPCYGTHLRDAQMASLRMHNARRFEAPCSCASHFFQDGAGGAWFMPHSGFANPYIASDPEYLS